MIIYKVTNTTNGKYYIGQTIQTLAQRRGGHYGDINDNTYFHRALLKYPKELWTWEVVETCDNIDTLNLKEQYWIGFYKANIREYGYNLSSGGLNCIQNEEARRNHSAALKGIVFTEEHKAKIKYKRQFQIFTDETRQKMSTARLGKALGYNKYIYNLIDKNSVIYNNISSLKQFCSQHKLNYDCVQTRFNQKKSTHKGWKIYRVLKSDINPTIQIKESNNE